MTARPTAAKGTFPYPHRTVAEADRDQTPFEPPVDLRPPLNNWVRAFWPHMVNTGGSLSRFYGWFPSRYTGRGWQAQFGSCLASVVGGPQKWFPLTEDEARNALYAQSARLTRQRAA